MSEEGIAIGLIVSALAWLVAVVGAFYFVGAVAGSSSFWPGPACSAGGSRA
jgi:hypothetical protein